MKTKSLLKITGMLGMLLFVSSIVFADHYHRGSRYQVTITNITKGQIFSPPILITHNKNFSLFQTGEPASPELGLLAEDGDAGDLIDLVSALPSVLDYAAADGPILPGKSVTVEITANNRYDFLSLAGMLVTTNDAFFSVQHVNVRNGQMVTAKAYDAGTEANSENCAYIPGPPCGSPGVRDIADAEGFIHIHSGIHGIGDLVPSRDDWQNPVAKIMIRKVR